jgi:hypothetical protein
VATTWLARQHVYTLLMGGHHRYGEASSVRLHFTGQRLFDASLLTLIMEQLVLSYGSAEEPSPPKPKANVNGGNNTQGRKK